MKYSIVQDIVTHPRLYEDLSQKNIVFYDICDSELGLDLIKNLMKDILNPTKDKNIRYVMENFFKLRAIEINDKNIYVEKIIEFFNVFEKHYINKTGFNFYLVKREESKIIDVLERWRCKRETIKTFSKRSKNRKNYV
tara:strand:+ start:7665 stop:8078 length:414 start_codon:yes stop_codon:yes gene_type:complete